jgi:SAM-dependent methyltransferase
MEHGMDWTAGYASDVEYTAGFYREQSPGFLNFVCVLHGMEPVPLNKSFTYFELGFGRGLTANLLAAANPQGTFYAADFNPGHVAGARQLAAAAQLDNLTLLENSFEELAQGQVKNLPQFDFITLHGIYTWVTQENRQHIVDFIARYLKPGGIVYLSYNAMPGWAVSLPLQRLLVEHADLFPQRSDVQVKKAAEFVEQLHQGQAGYFTLNPALKARLDMLKTGNPNYLVHEYMHKHWEPMYHVDVARDLAAAKLDFVGSADLPLAYPALYMSAEKQEILNTIPDGGLRETVKDYFLNTGFRKDVFVRGARKMSPARQAEWLGQVGLTLLMPRDQVTLAVKLVFGEVTGRADIYVPVLDALAKHQHTLAELSVLPALAGQTLSNLAQIAAILTASGQTALYFSGAAKEPTGPAHKMNRALADCARYGDDYQALASPLLGNGISANFIERLIYLCIAQNPRKIDIAAIARQIWPVIANQGRRMTKEGKALETEEENLAELTEQIKTITAVKLPIWQQLKMI